MFSFHFTAGALNRIRKIAVVGAAAALGLASQANANGGSVSATPSLVADALTPGEVAVATSFESASATTDAQRLAMLSSISALPTREARADALGQLSVRSYALLPHLAIQSMDTADRQVRQYLATRRDIAAEAPDEAEHTGLDSLNIMLTGNLQRSTYEERRDRSGARVHSGSIRFAADIAPVPGVLVGFTAGIEGLDVRLDPRKRPKSTQYNTYFGPYVSYNAEKFYVDAMFGYNYSDSSLRRQVGWSGFTDKLVSSAEGDGWSFSSEAGGRFTVSNVRVQPFVGLQYRYADVAGLRENGGAAALEVAPYKVESLRSVVGLRAATTVPVSTKWTLRPDVEVQWKRELKGTPHSVIEARSVKRDLPVFSLKPTGLAGSTGRWSLGVTATHSDRASIRLAYQGEYGADRDAHGFTLTLNRRF